MAYPAMGRTKVDDDVLFNFVVDKRTSRQATEALERNLLVALGAEEVSTPQFASETQSQKETLNVLLLHEKTRFRNIRRNSKHFPTIKVDFLSNKVLLRTKRTITISLATDLTA